MTAPTTTPRPVRVRARTVHLAAVAVSEPGDGRPRDCLSTCLEAARTALTDAGLVPGQVSVLLYTGVYRTAMLSEPAMAAVVADGLGLRGGSRLLAFDSVNGRSGFLQACFLAERILSRTPRRDPRHPPIGLVCTSESPSTSGIVNQAELGVPDLGAAAVVTLGSGG
ncbi:MAG TPA: hypothetical protein VI248_21730, partial [Kineosporiaceae bacterium]